jgi:hypothetical protein
MPYPPAIRSPCHREVEYRLHRDARQGYLELYELAIVRWYDMAQASLTGVGCNEGGCKEN